MAILFWRGEGSNSLVVEHRGDSDRFIAVSGMVVGASVSENEWQLRNVKFILWERMYHVNISVLIKLLQYIRYLFSSRKHLRTKVTQDFHVTNSKNWGNLGSKSK